MDFKSLSDPVVIVGNDGNDEKTPILNKMRPPRTPKVIGAVLTVLLMFAVGIGVYVVQRPTRIVPHAEEARPSPDLRIATPSASLRPN